MSGRCACSRRQLSAPVRTMMPGATLWMDAEAVADGTSKRTPPERRS